MNKKLRTRSPWGGLESAQYSTSIGNRTRTVCLEGRNPSHWTMDVMNINPAKSINHLEDENDVPTVIPWSENICGACETCMHKVRFTSKSHVICVCQSYTLLNLKAESDENQSRPPDAYM